MAAAYGVPELIEPGITRLVAFNAGDYTGPGTNTYLVGTDRVWIVDPGPDCRNHIDAVVKAVGCTPVEGILITHTHMDHSPAARALSDAFDAPVIAKGLLDPALADATEEDVDRHLSIDRYVTGGEAVGSGATQIRVLHTPGHFPNHLCFFLPATGVLFTGDHVMGWSTTAVVPPLGNMRDYLASLEVLAQQKARLALPSHGPAIPDVAARIEAIRAHRMARHAAILDCLAQGIGEPAAIADILYDGLSARLKRAAVGCVEAHLNWQNTAQ